MTSLNDARKAIYSLYVNGQGDFVPSTNLFFDNSPGTEPDTAWARLSVRHNFATQETLGTITNRKFERRGNVILNIFTPAGQGTSAADGYAETAQGIFEGTRISNTTVYFTDVIIREIGVEDNWYNLVVDAGFVYYITK